MRFRMMALFSVMVLVSVSFLVGCEDSDDPTPVVPEEPTPPPAPVPQADLVPALAPGSLWHFDMDGGDILIYVTNDGLAAAPSTHVEIEFDTTAGSQIIQATGTTGPLAPGETSTTVIRVVIPAGCFTPDCLFTIRVDSLNEVEESDETNNTIDQIIMG